MDFIFRTNWTMGCCKLKSVGLYGGKVCLAEWDAKEGGLSAFHALAGCTEMVYARLRTLEAVVSFRFLERALAVMAHAGLPVFAMASSAGSLSVVMGGDVATLQMVCESLSVFAEVELEREVEVICVQKAADGEGGMAEKSLVALLRDIPVLMVSAEEGAGSISLAVRRKDRDKVLDLFFSC